MENFDDKSLEAYERLAELIARICSVPSEAYADGSLPLNQAVCCALLVRISKYMRAGITLARDQGHLDAFSALGRCLFESAINCELFMLDQTGQEIQDFIYSSLKNEIKLLELIDHNVLARGGVTLPIEDRMRRKTRVHLAMVGWTLEDLPPKRSIPRVTFRDKLDLLGKAELYTTVHGTFSDAVHGNWACLARLHLRSGQEAFSLTPKFNNSAIDTRIIAPLGLFVSDAVHGYIEKYLDHRSEFAPELERICDELILLDKAHEESLGN